MSQPGSVPDPRLAELMEQLRRSTEESQRLKGMMDVLMTQRNQPPATPAQKKDYGFKPEFESAISAYVQDQLSSQRSEIEGKFRGAFNNLAEQNDELKFQQTYGREALDKYGSKIQEVRAQKAQQGQYLTRDEAYRFIAFEESGRKPKPQADTVVAPKPVFDPYLNQWVIPAQTQPTTPPPPQQQAQPQPAPPVSAQGQAPVTEQNHVVQPNGQVQTPDLTLPAEGNYQSAAPIVPDGRSMQGLDIERLMSDQKSLEQFASKYGDVPL